MFNKGLSDDIDFSFNVGANRMDRKYTRLSGEAGQLELPGVYSLANIRSGVSPVLTSFLEKSRINSIYGFGQIGFRNAVYLDFSGRNDWASVLPADNNSFFYPAVNLSVIASDLFNITSNTLSFLKIRGGWSKVGGIGALDPYKLVQTYSFRDDPWGSTLLPYNPETLNNPNLIAETTTGIEIGVDARLFRGRVTLDATYYNQTSADLILDAEISAASGYEFAFQNVGEMQNSGVELQLGLSAIKRKNLTVDVGVNFAKNTNLVKSLGDLDALILGGQWNVDIQAREGEPYGTIFGPGYLRNDEGSIVHANGLPQIDTENKILGNVTPDWTGGVTLDINFRGITVGAVVDAKIGGDIYSMTTTWGRYAGVLDETLKGRETGIVGEGVKVVTPAVVDPDTGDEITPAVYAPNDIVVGAESYNKAAYSNSVAEGSVFDASFVKLRQIVIGYDLPSKLFKGKVFKKASIALVGRNLAILYKKVPHIDPESAFSSSNGDQGLEFGQIPSVRSIGFNLNFDF